MMSDKPILASTSGNEAGTQSAAGPAEDVSRGSAVHDSALLVPDGSQGNGKEMPSSARHLPEDSPLAGLPMQLDVTVPIPQFRVHNLLALEKGAVLESRWVHTEDVPVWCGGEQLVWAEFEVVDQKLAVRVTRVG